MTQESDEAEISVTDINNPLALTRQSLIDRDQESNPIVLVLTLDGSLYALDKATGSLLWGTHLSAFLNKNDRMKSGAMGILDVRLLDASLATDDAPYVFISQSKDESQNEPNGLSSGLLLFKHSFKDGDGDEIGEANRTFLLNPHLALQHLIQHSPVHFKATGQVFVGRRQGHMIRLRRQDGEPSTTHSANVDCKSSDEGSDEDKDDESIALSVVEWELRAVEERSLKSHWNLRYVQLGGTAKVNQANGPLFTLRGTDTLEVKGAEGTWSVSFASPPIQVFLESPDTSSFSEVTVNGTAENQGDQKQFSMAVLMDRAALPTLKKDVNDKTHDSTLPILPVQLPPLHLDYYEPYLHTGKQTDIRGVAPPYPEYMLLPNPNPNSQLNTKLIFQAFTTLCMVLITFCWLKYFRKKQYEKKLLAMAEYIPLEVFLEHTMHVSISSTNHNKSHMHRQYLTKNNDMHSSSNFAYFAKGLYEGHPASLKIFSAKNDTRTEGELRFVKEACLRDHLDRHEHLRRTITLYTVGVSPNGLLGTFFLSLIRCGNRGSIDVMVMEPLEGPLKLSKKLPLIESNGQQQTDQQPLPSDSNAIPKITANMEDNGFQTELPDEKARPNNHDDSIPEAQLDGEELKEGRGLEQGNTADIQQQPEEKGARKIDLPEESSLEEKEKGFFFRSWSERVACCRQVAQAMAHLHEHHWLHGSTVSHNILNNVYYSTISNNNSGRMMRFVLGDACNAGSLLEDHQNLLDFFAKILTERMGDDQERSDKKEEVESFVENSLKGEDEFLLEHLLKTSMIADLGEKMAVLGCRRFIKTSSTGSPAKNTPSSTSSFPRNSERKKHKQPKDTDIVKTEDTVIVRTDTKPVEKDKDARVDADRSNGWVRREVLGHPLFWDAGHRLRFLLDVSDWLEGCERFAGLAGALELHAAGSLRALSSKSTAQNAANNGNNWLGAVHPALQESLSAFRKYSGRSGVDLLRAIRNKRHHTQELPQELRSLLFADDSDGAYWAYWSRLFPRLFGAVFAVCQGWGLLRDEPRFAAKYTPASQHLTTVIHSPPTTK